MMKAFTETGAELLLWKMGSSYVCFFFNSDARNKWRTIFKGAWLWHLAVPPHKHHTHRLVRSRVP